MTNLSIERLEIIHAETMEVIDSKPYATETASVEVNAKLLTALTGELLAYRKASGEAVAWTDKLELDEMNDSGRASMFKSRRAMGKPDPASVVKLYAAPQLPVVPKGYALVPIEPTYEMSEAIGLPWEHPPFPRRWKRMLEVARKVGGNG
ncbi:hypothetical protein FH968_04340 [Buttiauxella sp. B2]|uniref:hypothetical protein n=1 Tax=Buttiauxella sp. B2 TaxID=2587812 RepID=UPI00111DA305|nr:hypothetical protein [Buttiauxella sp. B2]TNV22111.1 hypothetical protein FH968_04340 [Buttiauxella sp. B2]